MKARYFNKPSQLSNLLQQIDIDCGRQRKLGPSQFINKSLSKNRNNKQEP